MTDHEHERMVELAQGSGPVFVRQRGARPFPGKRMPGGPCAGEPRARPLTRRGTPGDTGSPATAIEVGLSPPYGPVVDCDAPFLFSPNGRTDAGDHTGERNAESRSALG